MRWNPKNAKEAKKHCYNMYLEDGLRAVLEKDAERAGLSLNLYIVEVLKRFKLTDSDIIECLKGFSAKK